MSGPELPSVLQLDQIAPDRYRVNHPADDPEGRNIVFSGQLLGQMIMAADDEVSGEKEAKSIHAIFSRPATYEAPLELEVDTMQAGRAWASHAITATQNGKLMSRGMVLQSVDEPDLMRHAPAMPKVSPPEDLEEEAGLLVYPGAEARPVVAPDAVAADGSPIQSFWMRLPSAASWGAPSKGQAAHQAVLAWSEPGLLIGLAMRPHGDVVTIADAHRTISTGVIAHTAHFHDRIDTSDWLLVQLEATWAGRGRVHGSGRVFDRSGRYVASFEQDSMARTAPAPLGDAKRAM